MPAPCQAHHPGRGHSDWARFTVRTQRLRGVTSPARGHTVGAGSGCELESTAPGAVRMTRPCPWGPGAGALQVPLCQGVQPAQQPYRSLLQGQPAPRGPLPTGGSCDQDSYVFRPRAAFLQLGSRGPSAGLAPPCLQVPPQAQGEEKRLPGLPGRGATGYQVRAAGQAGRGGSAWARQGGDVLHQRGVCPERPRRQPKVTQRSEEMAGLDLSTPPLSGLES